MEAIYLDNAATSFPKPAGVSDRMKYYLDCVGANVNRSVYTAAQEAGLVTLIAVQTILNLCVVTNLLPSTGIALPFFSYGGTALAVNLGEMGIVLGISRGRNRRKINTSPTLPSEQVL